jgi:hypothetical protein
MRELNVNTMLCMALLFAVAICASFVAAVPNAPTSLTTVGSSSRDLSGQAAQSANAQGGNVTEMNINAITITKSWQGYYGNVTGQIALQDSNTQTFYNWSLTSFKARIFATRTNTVTWSGVNCTNSTNRTSEEVYLGQSSTDGDSVSNTFSGTSHPAFNVSTQQIIANTCYSTRGYANNNTQSSNYVMLLLSQSNGEMVYTTITNTSTTGFDGRQHDFELLVGENDKTGSVGVTPYYFWIEFE